MSVLLGVAGVYVKQRPSVEMGAPWAGFPGGQLHNTLDLRLTLWEGCPTANPV